ncbi:MAG: carboxy-S-adenosyl-L-methionine synthase CmoA [Candidatus Nitronauta litoralis]|uniref:Carboxy-S-adenosyl-L-methionine synthase n=1 Tax=Candidatus Nitronauta litoralis TaxID=2705533 RepID=A0A7T0BXU0_9BACT|nr:MAG: carboxy-S-adenosyl-L-methionine synthase CmoA [Candidatus Nitronauta litoralis]
MAGKKDNLFQSTGPIGKFEFNAPVVRVFDDMLARSVPFYKECMSLTVEFVCHYARPKTNVYDLGCSTGTLLFNLADRLPKSVKLVGIDNSPEMLKKAERKLRDHLKRCELVEKDLMKPQEFPNASVVVMNYTLQFVPPEKRIKMMKTINKHLIPGGALVLIEKIKGESEGMDNLFVDEHHRFKKSKGYSKLEIARKRQALEKVLVPQTVKQNESMLKRAGFQEFETFFRWCNFVGWVAVKHPENS